MFARIRARAPLVLASLLFGAGVAGLLFSTNTGPEWGPFQPRNSSSPHQRVILVQVGPEITPPPLHGLFTSATEPAFAQYVAAQVQAPPDEPSAAALPATATPVQQHDAAVSAAGATATPPPPLLIPGLAIDGSDETPALESTPAGE
jgi:hypothetical protein